MRVFVHAGLNKTGSTSLQAYFSQAREGLADAGLVYPDLGANSHWRLVTELLNDHEHRGGYLTRRQAERGSAGALDVVAKAIRQCREQGHDLLVSHENFGVRERLASLERFVISIDPAAELTVFAYCRESVSLFLSGVRHNLRRNGSYPELDGWTSGHVSRATRLHKALGPRLLLRGFAREVLHQGDVVEDFRAWLRSVAGRDLPSASKRFQRNVGLSAEGCGLILETADEARPVEDAIRLRSQIGAFDQAYPVTTGLALPERFANPIRAQNAQGWNELVDLMAHTEAEKASLLLAESVAKRARPRAFDRWLRAQVTPDYRESFHAYAADLKTRAAASKAKPD